MIYDIIFFPYPLHFPNLCSTFEYANNDLLSILLVSGPLENGSLKFSKYISPILNCHDGKPFNCNELDKNDGCK